MKLGDTITINRYVRKKPSESVNFEELTDEQNNELFENDELKYDRLEVIELNKPITGIVVGKRKIAKNITYTTGYHYDGSEIFNHDTELQDIYLVANRMDGFYRIPCEWVDQGRDEG